MFNSQKINNNPNPILMDVRLTLASDPEYLEDPIEYIETAWADMDGDAATEQAGWTVEHYEHARRVLERWAAL